MVIHRAILLGLLLLGLARCSQAGGGPENVLVVVNQNSHDSLTVANHYIRLRNVPPVNVVYLDWKGGDAIATGELFREEILKPIIEQIEQRRIALQIDYIVYSAGFPWRIDLRADLDVEKLPKQFAPHASITGATYLWPYVVQKNEAIVIPEVNFYVPPPAQVNAVRCQKLDGVKSRAFRSRYAWTAQREKTKDSKQGQRYFISSVLGLTVERGNTLPEIVQYLRTAAQVDGHGKQGTFYFMRRTRHPRTTPRQECFDTVANQMRAEGATVEIIEGELPEGKQVQGLMAGVGKFDLAARGVSIAPGAFCDDLTSYGGEFTNPAQTKLSAFLRAGAAGASGTVIEPYNFQAKFPLPSLHLHYFRGCSLGEAFYQSVQGPYQILLVGDPLCQPWAKPPKVEVSGIKPDQRVTGTVEIRTRLAPAEGTKSGTCELFIDGRLAVPQPFPPALPIPLDTAKLAPGRHELRVVASTGDELEMQGRATVEFDVASDDSQLVSIAIEPKPIVPKAGQLIVKVKAPAATTQINILQNRRVVGKIAGSRGTVSIPARQLGDGPVGLAAEATLPGNDNPSMSQIFWVFVE
jgi:uncharacterized protein (TIGR03790 family)